MDDRFFQEHMNGQHQIVGIFHDKSIGGVKFTQGYHPYRFHDLMINIYTYIYIYIHIHLYR